MDEPAGSNITPPKAAKTMKRTVQGILSILFTILILFYTSSSVRTNPSTTSNAPKSVPSSTVTPPVTHGNEYAKVVDVVDGDTIKIEGGEVVRYIGMNTPETVAPNRPIECFGKEASNRNKELVFGKTVMLEQDVSNRDKYGRLLRYVWLGDTMINEALVKDGYAQVSTYPPDVKYKDRFVAAQQDAQKNDAGLWGANCATVPTVATTSSVLSATTAATRMPTPTFVCDCTKSCERMSCAEAQYMLKTCGCTNRDENNNGIACDSQCH